MSDKEKKEAPTEKEKKEKKTTHKTTGKLHIGNTVRDIEITTETTPNAAGGYDTVVGLPSAFPIGATANEPGG